jgi:hypothetical protein
MWHFGGKLKMGIDPDTAEVKLGAQPHGARMVHGPHRRCEAMHNGVGEPDGLLLRGERLHRDDRPEDLLGTEPVIAPYPGDECRGEEVPGRADLVPGRNHSGTAARALDRRSSAMSATLSAYLKKSHVPPKIRSE